MVERQHQEAGLDSDFHLFALSSVSSLPAQYRTPESQSLLLFSFPPVVRVRLCPWQLMFRRTVNYIRMRRVPPLPMYGVICPHSDYPDTDSGYRKEITQPFATPPEPLVLSSPLSLVQPGSWRPSRIGPSCSKDWPVCGVGRWGRLPSFPMES